MFSALMKLIDLRNTIYFYSAVLGMSYNLTRMLLLMLIAAEFAFALFIISGHITKNVIFYLIASALAVFTIASIIFWVNGASNCGCFGTMFIESPVVSILKNIVLFIVLIILRRKAMEGRYA